MAFNNIFFNWFKYFCMFLILNNFHKNLIKQSSARESPISEALSNSLNYPTNVNNNNKSSSSLSPLSIIKSNNFKISSLVEKSVTLMCSIDLDDKNFSKSGNYKIIWSREIDNGKDYEPLALDDTRLIQNERILPSRILISKQTHEQIQWTLVINNLKLSDSNNYICQLNRKPYDIFWLKRFMLNVYEPASFIDENSTTKNQNLMYVESVNEHEDFKLKCLAKGKPKPSVTWYLKYFNGSSSKLDISHSEIIIKNIKRNSKLDKVECQVSNGYGAIASRLFKININHAPVILSKPKSYKIAIRTNEVKLNCTVVSNPTSTINWYHFPIKSNEQGAGNWTFDEERKEKSNLNGKWKLINTLASYSYSLSNRNQNLGSFNNYFDSLNQNVSTIAKLPLSKYQINEKQIKETQINSLLTIRLINEKDFGLYRCAASNNLGNKSIEHKIEKLYHDSLYNKKNNNLINSAYGLNRDDSESVLYAMEVKNANNKKQSVTSPLASLNLSKKENVNRKKDKLNNFYDTSYDDDDDNEEDYAANETSTLSFTKYSMTVYINQISFIFFYFLV